MSGSHTPTHEVKSSDVVRREDGTIASGTANPGGMPKWLKEVRQGLKDMHPGAKARLASIIANGSDKDAATAIRVLYDFTLPKPKVRVKVEGAPDSPFAGLSLEDLLALGRGVKASEEKP